MVEMKSAVRCGLLLQRHRELFGDVPTTVLYEDIEDLCLRLPEAIRTLTPLTSKELARTTRPVVWFRAARTLDRRPGDPPPR
jgi:hypothetical protein